MKTIKQLVILSLLAVGTSHATTLLVSDFSTFTPTLIVQPQPVVAADGPWSALTTHSGATAFTVDDFGNGTPSGLIGNGFFQYLAASENWSGFSFLQLTGWTPSANATPSLYFYIEDANSNTSSATQIDLTGFGPGASTASVALDRGLVDLTQIVGWGFVTNEATPTAFAFTFDHLEFSDSASTPAVPDASSSALLLGLALFGLAGLRRAVWRA